MNVTIGSYGRQNRPAISNHDDSSNANDENLTHAPGSVVHDEGTEALKNDPIAGLGAWIVEEAGDIAYGAGRDAVLESVIGETATKVLGPALDLLKSTETAPPDLDEINQSKAPPNFVSSPGDSESPASSTDTGSATGAPLEYEPIPETGPDTASTP